MKNRKYCKNFPHKLNVMRKRLIKIKGCLCPNVYGTIYGFNINFIK